MESARKITPTRALEILKKADIIMDEDKVKLVLNFLYARASMTIDNYLEQQSNTTPVAEDK